MNLTNEVRKETKNHLKLITLHFIFAILLLQLINWILFIEKSLLLFMFCYFNYCTNKLFLFLLPNKIN